MAKVVPLPCLIKSEAHQIGKAAILLSLHSVGCTKLNPEIILISSEEGHLRMVNLSKWKILERESPRRNRSYHQHGVMPLWKQRLSLSSTALLDKVPIEEKPKERAVTHPERSETSSVLLFFVCLQCPCVSCVRISQGIILNIWGYIVYTC